MWLIDGYNLLFSGLRGRILRRELEAERNRLVHLIQSFCRVSAQRAIVIFDHTRGAPVYGVPLRHNLGEVEIRYTTEDVTADEEIIAMLAATKDRTAWTVVTSDRAIAEAAEKGRFRVLPSPDFADDMARALRGSGERGPERTLSRDEVDYWMKEFGIGEK